LSLVSFELHQSDAVLGQRASAASEHIDLETLDIDLHANYVAIANQRIDRDQLGLDWTVWIKAINRVQTCGEPGGYRSRVRRRLVSLPPGNH
jgi:hypothetical protein